MRKLRLTSPFSLATIATVVFGLSFIWGSPFSLTGSGGAEAAGSASDAFSIDMNTTGNTASGLPAGHTEVLGTVESCARINENDIQDADETAVDTITLDVTATNIPASTAMIAFAYSMDFSSADMTVASQNTGFLLAAQAGSAVLYVGDSPPDTDGVFNSSAADTSTSTPESGSGVLQRLTISSNPSAVLGIYPLTLHDAAHVDGNNDPWAPDAFQNASVAINRSCPLPPVDIELVSLSLASVNPIEPAGTNFTLAVQATANNNGPNPADIRFDLGIAAPGDCTLTPPGNQTEDFLGVLPTESRTSTLIWTANCATPSTHLFSGSGTVAVIGLADETTPANNGPLSDPESVGITGDADVKVASVVVDAPPDAATGAPFTVNVTATLHNNGPLDPVNVDTTIDLQMPPGCLRVPDAAQVVGNTSLSLSTPVPVQSTWTVSCNTTGLKTFTATANAAIDQLHTTDPNLVNNDGQGQDTTDTSLGVADVKVTSVAVAAPASAPVNTNFPVTVSTTVHNNGPFFPVNADVTLTLNLPADCFTPVSTIVFQDASLGPSIAAQLPDITFYVACINHSFHNITATATVAIDDPLAGDPNPLNNTQTSAAATTAIIRTVDHKVVSETLSGPPNANTGVPFNVLVDTTLHNNGPDDGPVDVSTGLSLPTDCTTPINPIITSANLAPSVATALPTASFAVTCTGESFHDFEATTTLSTPLHVVDSNAVNDSLASGITTVPVIGIADLKVTSVVASGPAQANSGVPFDVTVTPTLHNNGPFGPVNADASVTLNLPTDCSTPDANPRPLDNIALPVSAAIPAPAIWSVTCTDKSSHSFSAGATVTADQLHVEDQDLVNNAGNAAPVVVPVFVQADGKITSAMAVSPPAFIASSTNVTITVRTVIHNNGPFGPATFDLSRAIAPIPGCTVTPPAASSHALAVSAPITIDAIWTINCAPGTYTFNFSNTLTVNDLHVTDPAAANNTGVATATISVDTDGDGIPDDVESACGSNPLNGASIPERIDGVYAGADDDLDLAVDEALPSGAVNFDCDRDGYKGSAEDHVYNPSTQGDQDPCGTNVLPPTVPPTPIGWPADLQGSGIPDSSDKVNILDITSFLAPIRYFNTNVGSNPGDRRWDLVPGAGFFPVSINIADLSNLLVLAPPMLGGTRALNGPSCPFPP